MSNFIGSGVEGVGWKRIQTKLKSMECFSITVLQSLTQQTIFTI